MSERERLEEDKAAAAAPWPTAKRGEEKGFWRRMKRERERELPNEDFLLISTLIYLTSFNEIMPSAPLTSFLYISTYSYK